MRIVITGSNGFIGKPLVEALKNAKHDLVEVDLSLGYDVSDWDSIKNIKDFDILIHLAAIMYVPKSYEIPREVYNVNIIGTLNVLELCRINNAKMIFNSSYVYGRPRYLPIDENHPVVSFNPYCQSKIIGEKLCESYFNDFNVPITILRIFNVYGPGQNNDFLIPTIFDQVNMNKEVKLKDPRPKRDYIFIEDVVDAYKKVIEHSDFNNDIFNIGSGISYSVKEIAEIITSFSESKIKIDYSKEKRSNEILDTIADIRKIKKQLNWEPMNSIETGLRKIKETYH